jgi:hypothetical protein
MQPSCKSSLTVPVLTISRCDRWLACQRLQDLSIPCYCTEDGYLHVEVAHPTAIAQVKSVIQQLTAPRTALVGWLEQCWKQPEVSDFQ